jgi:hypothetical protein
MVLLSGRARNTGWVDSLAAALEELEKLAHVHPRLPQNGAQRAAVQFPVVRDDDLRKRALAAEDHVAALLPPQREAHLREGVVSRLRWK